MTVAENPKSLPLPAMPPRPARPLSTWQLLRVGFSNTLAACDEETFEELFVERHYAWGRMFVINDPDGIKRVLQDNAALAALYRPLSQKPPRGEGLASAARAHARRAPGTGLPRPAGSSMAPCQCPRPADRRKPQHRRARG